MRTNWLVALAAAALCASLPVGCSKVGEGNYERIKDGMTVEEVKSILGEPTRQAGGEVAVGDLSVGGRTMTWQEGEKRIVVTFANGKVVAKLKENF